MNQDSQNPSESADDCRRSLVSALHFLASDFENALYKFGGDDEARRHAEGSIAHARKVAARWNWNGAPTSPEGRVLMDAADCHSCEYLHMGGNGWCYMFQQRPDGNCAQYRIDTSRLRRITDDGRPIRDLVEAAAEIDRLRNELHGARADIRTCDELIKLSRVERDKLRLALNAMLTQFGMDEDEFSKPTFNQARKALGPV